MKKIITFSFFAAFSISLYIVPTKSNKLKDVHEIASKGHKRIDYKDTWQLLYAIDGSNEKVNLIYSGESRSIYKRGASKGCWNREHLWPCSFGIERTGIDYSDLHNLRPCDMQNNSRRGNKMFGYESDQWYVPFHLRGDVARSLFYMAARYNGKESHTNDLRIAETANQDNYTIGGLSMLIEWHNEDKVDDEERARHERVYHYQGNRNPFIDDPELVKIFE